MKSWQETTRIYAELDRLFAAGQTAALATLIRIEGSSYRRPGAKLLIRADGSLLGQVSGGCLENDLRERAQRLIADGAPPEIVHYDTGADDHTLWGLGLGCDGKLDVFLQRLDPAADAEHLKTVRARLAGVESFTLRTLLDGPEAGHVAAGPPFSDEKTGIVVDNAARMFVDHLEPPPDLVVIGTGDDAIPLVALAAEAGFRVTVVDHRSAYLAADRFPKAYQRLQARPEAAPKILPRHIETYVVVKNHALVLDQAWAAYFAGTPAPYIGLLGPKTRREEIMRALPEDARLRVYGPVGLDIKAEGAEQVAISIVAELLAVEAGRSGGFLRARAGAIHG